MSENSNTENLRKAENVETTPSGYYLLPEERKRELGTMVTNYFRDAKEHSIEDCCKYMHEHCRDTSEALFVGAFADFMSMDEETRKMRMRNMMAKMLGKVFGSVFADALKEAKDSLTKEEDDKEKSENAAEAMAE